MEGRNQVEPCNCQPLEIPHEEIIARAIFYSFHVKSNGKLKWAAFEPDLNANGEYEDDLSVMRTPCVKVPEGRQRAIAMNTQIPRKEYRGFALLHTGMLRLNNFDARDSRHVYCGHADLILGLRDTNAPSIQAPKGEPVDAIVRVKQQDAGNKLKSLCAYRPDSELITEEWPKSDPQSPQDLL